MHNQERDYHRRIKGKGQPAASILGRFSPVQGMAKADLMVGLLVAGLVVSLVVMGVARQTGAARRNFCEKKQTSIAAAFKLYATVHREYPGWRQPVSGVQANKAAADKIESWPVAILPWLGRPFDADELNGNRLVDDKLRGPYATEYDEWQKSSAAKYIADLVCSSDARLGQTTRPRPAWLSFVANTGMPDRLELTAEEPFPDRLANGVLFDYTRAVEQRSSPAYVSEHDGEEFTLLLTENIDAQLWTATEEATLGFVWTIPPGLAINEQAGRGDGSIRFARPASGHRGGVNVVFCGENTRFLSEKLDLAVLRELMRVERE